MCKNNTYIYIGVIAVRYIYKLFFENKQEQFEKIHQERLNYDSAIPLSLSIKPLSQPHLYELYYIPTNDMIQKVSQLLTTSSKFTRFFSELPPVAQKQFINECIVEELYNTNDLEGIRSTKEEIARSTRNIKLSRGSNNRFDSMIKSYMSLLFKKVTLPKHPLDIRKIYDDITKGEIEEQELPDGDIFRKEPSYVLKKSGSGKVIHQGMTPESKIIEQIELLLKFMNNNNEIPTLIKVAIGHYYYGYLHPFYDGNGRTSRFISSLYLSEILGDISTLSLSRGCNKNKKKYMESFEITNSMRNRGEMNGFIETFLDIMIDALQEMSATLKEKYELLNIVDEKIKHEPKLKKQPDKFNQLMFVLAQNHFFDQSEGITVQELAEIFSKSEATIRKELKQLLSLSLIEQKNKKPAFYSIKQQYFEESSGEPMQDESEVSTRNFLK